MFASSMLRSAARQHTRPRVRPIVCDMRYAMRDMLEVGHIGCVWSNNTSYAWHVLRRACWVCKAACVSSLVVALRLARIVMLLLCPLPRPVSRWRPANVPRVSSWRAAYVPCMSHSCPVGVPMVSRGCPVCILSATPLLLALQNNLSTVSTITQPCLRHHFVRTIYEALL